MTHRQYTTAGRKKAIRIVEMIIFFSILLAASFGITNSILTARAEGQTVRAWILCQPKDYVNARTAPSTKSESIGILETGYEFEIDGKTKNGFAHAIVSLESESAWIHAGYIVFDEPKDLKGALRHIRSDGRVAARKRIGGERRCWVNDGDVVKVYYQSAEWSVTDKGFIKTEFIGGT